MGLFLLSMEQKLFSVMVLNKSPQQPISRASSTPVLALP